MNNAACNATIFQPRHFGEEFPRPPMTSFYNPEPLAPQKKEFPMCILKIWREHREQLIKQRLRLL